MSEDPRLVPTGNCYEEAAMHISGFGQFSGWTLVHGRPTLQRPPFIKFGHAWLESPDGEICWDPITMGYTTKYVYYELGRIEEAECFRYDLSALRRWITKTGHWGPWEGEEGCGPLPGFGEEE